MSKTSLKRGILIIFVSNAINLLINLLRGFVIPKFLPVESYAMIKDYQLYMSYVGVLHFGYIDNVYLKYGGSDVRRIDKDELSRSHSNVVCLESILALLLFPVALLTRQFVLAFFALSLLPTNLIEYYKNIFQATGEFGLYSRVIYLTTFITFGGSIFLLFGLNYLDYKGYIIIYFLSYILLWIYLELVTIFKLGVRNKFRADFHELVKGCKNGFALMLGNFSSILLTSMDRWFVKFLLTVSDFAYYSFAVSLENLITVFVSPVVTTFYNYLCREKDVERIVSLKKVCMVAGLFMITLAFPAKFILQIYLTKYIYASNVLFALFATQAMYLVIKGIYVNVYKARGMQKEYFKQLLKIIVLGFILNVLFFLVSLSIESIAYATFLSVVVWWILCAIKLKEFCIPVNKIFAYFLCLICFLLLGYVNNTILACIIYIVCITVISFFFFNDSVKYLLNIIKNFIKRKVK